jgi:hypothetical protein
MATAINTVPVKCYRWREADNTGIFYSRTISFIHVDIPFCSYTRDSHEALPQAAFDFQCLKVRKQDQDRSLRQLLRVQ